MGKASIVVSHSHMAPSLPAEKLKRMLRQRSFTPDWTMELAMMLAGRKGPSDENGDDRGIAKSV
jgi:hypothetical protein